jgi:lipopolysaccharide heptosyltransferase II
VCSEIVRLHDQVDEVIVFERKAGLRGILPLIRAIRSRDYDVTLDLQRHIKSGFFSWISRAPRRIGFHPRDSKEWNWIFNTEWISEQGERISKVEHYLLFLDKLGIPRPPRELLSAGLEGVTFEYHPLWAEELQRPYVGFILGSSWDSKDWPEEGYVALLQQLNAAGRVGQIVLLGDRSKVEMAGRISAQASPSDRVVNLVGRTTLRELVVVIAGAEAIVGPDSGPAHIAGAVGTPHITLFGPTPAGRNAPLGSEHLSLSAPVGCAPCKRRLCPGLNKVCMRLVSPQQVLEKLQMLGDGAPPKSY